MVFPLYWHALVEIIFAVSFRIPSIVGASFAAKTFMVVVPFWAATGIGIVITSILLDFVLFLKS